MVNSLEEANFTRGGAKVRFENLKGTLNDIYSDLVNIDVPQSKEYYQDLQESPSVNDINLNRTSFIQSNFLAKWNNKDSFSEKSPLQRTYLNNATEDS